MGAGYAGVSFDFGSRLYIQLDSRMYNLLSALRTNGGGGRGYVGSRLRDATTERPQEGGPGYVGSRLRGNDEWVGAGMRRLEVLGLGFQGGSSFRWWRKKGARGVTLRGQSPRAR